MSTLRGKRVSLVGDLGEHDIHWRDPRPVGFLELGHVLRYKVLKYKAEEGGEEMAVFVQHDWALDKYFVVTDRFQYGDLGGRPFLVYHDKHKYQPYQQSFLCAGIADLILTKDDEEEEEEDEPSFGFAFSWGFLDRLKDFS